MSNRVHENRHHGNRFQKDTHTQQQRRPTTFQLLDVKLNESTNTVGGLLLLCWYILNSVTREKENCGALKDLFQRLLENVSLADSVICVVIVFIFQRHESKSLPNIIKSCFQ